MTESHDYTIGRKKQKAFDKIAEALEKSEGLFPKTLALQTGMKWSTIRNYLREMGKLGTVCQKDPRGPYYLVRKTPHGMEEPRIHALRFGFACTNRLETDKEDGIELHDGQLRLSIKAYQNTGKMECQVQFNDKKAKKDLSLGEAILIGDIFRFAVLKMTGILPGYADTQVVTSEFNWDFAGVHLDSVECVTLNVLKTFEKLYNKGQNTLRYEIRPRPFGLKELLGIMQGGAAFSAYIQAQTVMEEKIERLQESVYKVGLGLYEVQKEVGKLCNQSKPRSKTTRSG